MGVCTGDIEMVFFFVSFESVGLNIAPGETDVISSTDVFVCVFIVDASSSVDGGFVSSNFSASLPQPSQTLFCLT